jgi:hypothetical protein
MIFSAYNLDVYKTEGEGCRAYKKGTKELVFEITDKEMYNLWCEGKSIREVVREAVLKHETKNI